MKLKDGESLKLERRYSKGFMQETDVEEYSIVDGKDEVTGKVRYTDHTAVRGFRRTMQVVQSDRAGATVVDIIWHT
ncbi:hypothetical protein [Ralstonia insidiosa]|uniref:hypothetical protein n=1 Tax=Ralstonia insidiosa TaxID=190721 RepID=UPI001427D714|nr:hypothetical protein [Ralstonia insidiosa]